MGEHKSNASIIIELHPRGEVGSAVVYITPRMRQVVVHVYSALYTPGIYLRNDEHHESGKTATITFLTKTACPLHG